MCKRDCKRLIGLRQIIVLHLIHEVEKKIWMWCVVHLIEIINLLLRVMNSLNRIFVKDIAKSIVIK